MREDLKDLVAGVTGAATMAALKKITSKTAWKGSAIGSLGQLPFVCSRAKVLTFSELSKENSERWAKHEVIGRKPVLENIGPDLSTITMTIRFDLSLGAPPLIYLNRLKRMLENGEYKTLIIGGEYLGKWVITDTSEARLTHTGAGICRSATITITLLEYAK